MELKHQERTIRVKIVYYGPAVGGKTTNLHQLHAAATSGRSGDLVSINSAQDRTILFDMLPIKAVGFRGFELRFQVIAVPGQAMYAATRKLVLRGADGLVFVANSAVDRWQESVSSLREMTAYLQAHQLDPETLPLVVQYNKRDLPEVTPLDQLDRFVNLRKVPAFTAVATRGEGVLETFSAILSSTMGDLANRYKILQLEDGQTIADWTHRTILGIFGTSTLAQATGNEAPRPSPPEENLLEGLVEDLLPQLEEAADHRQVQVTLPDEAKAAQGIGPDARAFESLAESYAEASTELAQQLEEVREERDRARRWVDDLRQTMLATETLLLGHPPQLAFRAVLGRMIKSTDCRVASVLIPQPDGSAQTLACLGVAKDPMLTYPGGSRLVSAQFLPQKKPAVRRAIDDAELRGVLTSGTPFSAVASVPLRGGRVSHGVCMLYFTADVPTPGDDALAHLGSMARGMGVALELMLPRSEEKASTALSQAAATGLAALRGLGDINASLKPLWEQLQSLGVRPGLPSAVSAEIAGAAGLLIGVARRTRSLAEFGRGELRRESLEVAEILTRIRDANVKVHADPNLGAVFGDRTLLTLALDVMVELARRAKGDNEALDLRASSRGQVLVSILVPSDPPTTEVSVEEALLRHIAELHGGSLSIGYADGAIRFALTLPGG